MILFTNDFQHNTVINHTHVEIKITINVHLKTSCFENIFQIVNNDVKKFFFGQIRIQWFAKKKKKIRRHSKEYLHFLILSRGKSSKDQKCR